MQSHRALAVLSELRALAAQDGTRLAAAQSRLVLAEAEVAAARSACASASMRAEVSQRVTLRAEELLAPAAGPCTGPPPPPRDQSGPHGKPRTIAQEVLDFVRLRGSATRAEIIQQVRRTRPGTNPTSVERRLGRLVNAGELVRVERGLYALPPTAAEGDA
ncbi:hypothetical protein ACIG3E_33290 [Streptomyces sp. NPDC053474]|uniref:hypothetical protein n=1 Tax=Streptomyces sp. NPDC053474 TaxID=3365704 RepID=UPI0037D26AD7